MPLEYLVDFKNAGIYHLDQIANIMFTKSTNAQVTDVCRKICLQEDDIKMELKTMTDFIAVAVEVKIPENNISEFISLFERSTPDFKK